MYLTTNILILKTPFRIFIVFLLENKIELQMIDWLQRTNLLIGAENIQHLQKVNSWLTSTASTILVELKQETNAIEAKEVIQNKLGTEYAAFTLEEVYPQLFDWLSLVDTNAIIISVLMLIVSCISS